MNLRKIVEDKIGKVTDEQYHKSVHKFVDLFGYVPWAGMEEYDFAMFLGLVERVW